MYSVDFETTFAAPLLTLDDSFQSNPKSGTLSYRLPSLEDIFGLPIEFFESYDLMTFILKVQAVTAEGSETLSCTTGSYCYIYYRRYTTAPIFFVTPPVMYYESKVEFFFNPRYIPQLIYDLGPEDLPIINAKIGLGRLDFDGFMDETTTISKWVEQSVRGKIGEQDIAIDNVLSMQWETGGS